MWWCHVASSLLELLTYTIWFSMKKKERKKGDKTTLRSDGYVLYSVPFRATTTTTNSISRGDEQQQSTTMKPTTSVTVMITNDHRAPQTNQANARLVCPFSSRACFGLIDGMIQSRRRRRRRSGLDGALESSLARQASLMTTTSTTR